jgi:hypothetical protein
MKLSDQVITYDQAVRLKELGVAQEAYFSYIGDLTPRLMEGDDKHPTEYGPWIILRTTKPYNNQDADWRDDVAIKEPFAAAFTLAELGQALPWRLEYQGRLASWDTTPYIEGDPDRRWIAAIFWIYQSPDRPMMVKNYIPAPAEAQARAALLIHLLESHLIKVEDVNARLKQ